MSLHRSNEKKNKTLYPLESLPHFNIWMCQTSLLSLNIWYKPKTCNWWYWSHVVLKAPIWYSAHGALMAASSETQPPSSVPIPTVSQFVVICSTHQFINNILSGLWHSDSAGHSMVVECQVVSELQWYKCSRICKRLHQVLWVAWKREKKIFNDALLKHDRRNYVVVTAKSNSS